jgi:hypothetical protein
MDYSVGTSQRQLLWSKIFASQVNAAVPCARAVAVAPLKVCARNAFHFTKAIG